MAKIIESVRRLDVTGRFFEGPRWHDGRWWVSDMSAGTVSSISTDGRMRCELALDDRPSGLGWLPDGSLVVAAMDSRRVYRREADGRATLYADLSALCDTISGHINDMVATPEGHLYVGFDPDFGEHGFTSELGAILHVHPGGKANIAARGLHFPNGMVVTHDGSTLIVAETGTPRLTAFLIGRDGALGAREVWAEVRVPAEAQGRWGDAGLDGCALDADGCIWVANANSSSCLRVRRGGEIIGIARIPEAYRCLACALGGDDGNTLLMCGLELDSGEGLEQSISHLFVAPILA